MSYEIPANTAQKYATHIEKMRPNLRREVLKKAMEKGYWIELNSNSIMDFRLFLSDSTSRGGPIGLDLTSSIAQVFMIWWDRELIKKSNELKLDLFMDTRYVDDIDVALPPVQPGARYVNGVIKVLAEKVEEDEE